MFGITAGEAIIGSAIIGGISSANAADTQAEAGQRSIDAQKGMFDTTQKNIAPFVSTGQEYAKTLSDLGKTDYATHQFNANDLKSNLAPNYDWVRQQGLMAADNAGSAQGGLAGTNARRSAIDYAEGLAGNAYQQAFSNYNNQRTSIFSNLNSIASLGSNAAVGQGNIAAKTGESIGGTLTGIGNVQGAGQMGIGNAITGGLNSLTGYNLSNVGKTPGSVDSNSGSAFSGWDPLGSSAAPAWGNNPSAFIGP